MLNRREFLKTATIAAAGLTLVPQAIASSAPIEPLSLPSEFVISCRRKKKRYDGPETDFLSFDIRGVDKVDSGTNIYISSHTMIQSHTCVVIDDEIIDNADFADCGMGLVCYEGKVRNAGKNKIQILFKSEWHRDQYETLAMTNPWAYLTRPITTAGPWSVTECLRLRIKLDGIYSPPKYEPLSGSFRFGTSLIDNKRVLMVDFN